MLNVTKLEQVVNQGMEDGKCRISYLRAYFDEEPREELDKALNLLCADGRYALWPMDDPQERTKDDDGAAIDICGVAKRHIVVKM